MSNLGRKITKRQKEHCQRKVGGNNVRLRISVTELEIQKTYTYWELEEETLIFCFRINYNI